ncbi:pancreatic lipase-related protein 2-like [Anopheles albimanus]|uniref:pancreatic lipase-related protein 2-like n=1 Tax=Anopheles albimanus TaxID=7167 RepID=UPI0016409869|nr:pancreatic lipase-related protein 2-like [Anopheles albimanus]
MPVSSTDRHCIFSLRAGYIDMELVRILFFTFLVAKEQVYGATLLSQYQKEMDEVKLYFYTPHTTHDVTKEDIYPSLGVQPQKQLKVLIHGWNAACDHIATLPIQSAYLIRNDCNLLVADWSNVSAQLYPTARKLVLPVGYRIASILARFMDRFAIGHDQVHIIGHSLGAHVAGNVGRYFAGRLARITALDPAGPLFRPNSRDAVAPTAAQLVDVIHTDGSVLGELVLRGHIDFFPNGGLSPQPGCETLDLLTLHACSHYRSTGFFAESILLPNNFIARQCNIQQTSTGQPQGCLPVSTNFTLEMGDQIDNLIRGTFFLQTAPVPPYGLGNITTAKSSMNARIGQSAPKMVNLAVDPN